MTGGETHFPLPANGCYDKHTFHPCKRFPYTTSNSSTKWEIAKSRKCRFCFQTPSLGIKPLWLVIVALVMMHYILTHHNGRTRWYGVLAQSIVIIYVTA